MRVQYHFRPSPNGLYAWSVASLIEAARDLPVMEIPLSDISEINENYWFQNGQSEPSVAAILTHLRLAEDADLMYPIILCAKGRLMDGMHRILKALYAGDRTIKAVRFTQTPPPDYTDVTPDELCYE